MTTVPQRLDLPPHLVEQAVASALAEDLGQAGDITTDPIVSAASRSEASHRGA